MDRLEAMAMLVQVVERGSLSAAGRALRVPVPTLSRKISELEAQLGAKLLVRTTRKLSLTDSGVSYLAAAKRILEQVEDAEREAAGEYTTPKGELILTAPVMFGRRYVLPVVAEFLAQYPSISVRLLLGDRNVHLVEDQVDMAVRIGALQDSTLVASRVGSMRTVVCASPALLARHGEPRVPEDLQRLPCVAFDLLMQSLGWRFVEPAGSAGQAEIRVTPRLVVTTADAALEAAIMGVGVTRLLHYHVAPAVANGDLKIVLADHESAPMPVHLVHAARGQMPLKMRRFIDFAAQRLRERLDVLNEPAGVR